MANSLCGLLILSSAVLSCPAKAQPNWFVFYGGPNELNGVSADGSIAVGSQSTTDDELAGFVFEVGSGRECSTRWADGFLTTRALAVSPDGRMIGGFAAPTNNASPRMAVRWVLDGVVARPEPLGDLPAGVESSALYAVSSGGDVHVGSGRDASGLQALRWSRGTGFTTLGDLPGGGFRSGALGVSADGSLIVGFATGSAGVVACTWTGAVGPTPLHLPAPSRGSVAYGVSADGSVIVGALTTVAGLDLEARVWDAHDGEIIVPAVPGQSAAALLAATSDGGLAGGYCMLHEGQLPDRVAMLWDPIRGVRLLRDVLRDEVGVDIGGFRPAAITGMSADGTVLVGYGTSGDLNTGVFCARRGFIARLPRPCSADVDGSGGFDGADVELFFTLWEKGSRRVDFDRSGGVDGADVEAFFRVWEAGEC